MTPDRVRQIIDAYGADAHRWPAGERSAAQELVRSEATLTAYLEQARALDSVLDLATTAQPSEALRRSILAERPAAHVQDASVGAGSVSGVSNWWRGLLDQLVPGVPGWQPVAGFAASLLVGVWLGAQGIVPVEDGASESFDTAAVSLVYGDAFGFGGWEDDG